MPSAEPLACPLCASYESRPLATDAGEYFHCGECDLRFLHHGARLDAHEEKTRYQSHENQIDDPGYRKFLEPLFHEIGARVRPGAHGLDFGAGPGPALADMFRVANFNVEIYDPYFWPDESKLEQTYDFVVASEVVEHLYSPAEEFARLFSLLKPGGHLGLMTLLVEPHTDFATWYYRRDPTHVVFYSRATFEWIAHRFGFSELSFRGERVVTLRRPS
jgi:hypothetical protein